MKQEIFTSIILTADEGHYLTNAGDVPVTERIIAQSIAISRDDSPDNYREITAGIADEYRKAQADAIAYRADARIARYTRLADTTRAEAAGAADI